MARSGCSEFRNHRAGVGRRYGRRHGDRSASQRRRVAAVRAPRVPCGQRHWIDVARLGPARLARVSACSEPADRCAAGEHRPDCGLADLHGRVASMPRFDPATWRLQDRRPRRRLRRHVQLRGPDRDASRRAGLDVPLRHGLVGEERPLGRCSLRRLCSTVGARRRRTRAQHSCRPRSRTSTRSRPRRPDSRDVMLAYEMDGKPLASRPRGAGAARDPGDVRLQEREVGRADHRRVRQAEPGYWEQRGYDTDAWVGASNGF